MHDWNDTLFDWEALDKAGAYLSNRCAQFARLGVHVKEKYGTLRVSPYYFSGYSPLHEVFKPGYCYYQWPGWVRTYIDEPIGEFVRFIRLDKPIRWVQRQTLKFFWKRTAKKWPHIKKEIMDEYNFIID